jgi:hypothetical protein
MLNPLFTPFSLQRIPKLVKPVFVKDRKWGTPAFREAAWALTLTPTSLTSFSKRN